MNKRLLRLLLKWSFLVNILFFGLAYADYVLWDSIGMVAILSFYALFLVAVAVLLIVNETPRYRRVEFSAPDEGPKTIIYGRR